MRTMLVILACMLFTRTAAAETEGALPKLDAAHAAFDRGDFNQAQVLYEEVIRDSGASAELFYNAGNAAFRREFIGQAVLFYRRAWYLTPRDADIKANMELARQRTGFLAPEASLFQRAAQELSHREWTRLFKISFWIAVAITALSIAVPAARRFSNLPAALSACFAVASLTGWLYWRQWQARPEVIVIRGGETARYEPRAQSTPHFATPEGSILIREETFDNWLKVRDGSRTGWLPADAVEQVYPWQTLSK